MNDSLFLTDLQKSFNESNLYKIYELESKCSNAQIKKAYKKMSLLYHPDRNDVSLKEDCTKKFQLISKIHYILSDNDRRLAYDQYGTVDEEWTDDIEEWEAYWRVLYPKITLTDISKFEKNYKNSAEEKEDLIKLYIEYKGDMDKIMESLMLSTVSDEPRYRAIIDDMINKKEVPAFKDYLHETPKKATKRKKMEEKENKEYEQNGDDIRNLVSAIQGNRGKRANDMNNFFDNLEAKYSTKKDNGRKQKKKL